MSDASHELNVVLDTGHAEIARAAAQALAVETQDAPPGTRVHVRAENERLLVRFEAGEPRTLRAAVHSYLRLADVAIATAQRASR